MLKFDASKYPPPPSEIAAYQVTDPTICRSECRISNLWVFGYLKLLSSFFVRWGCYDVVFFSGLCSLTSELVSLAAVFVSSHNALREETKTAARETTREQALHLGCDCENSSLSASGTKKDTRVRGVGKQRRATLPPFAPRFAHRLEWRACLQALLEAVGLTIWNSVR